MSRSRSRAAARRPWSATPLAPGGALAGLAFALALALAAGCSSGDVPPRTAEHQHDRSGAHAGEAHIAAAPTTEDADAGRPATGVEPETPQEGRDADDALVHHGFGDVQRWAKVFDDPGRDTWQKPNDVIAAMTIRPGMMVADLGAGTGYFTVYLSRAVGPEGTVLAIDPEPEMVRFLGQRARRDGLGNVLPVLGMYEDPFLPRGRVDRVLIVDTYHHIDDRLDYFGRMRRDVAPGGRVVIVDFHKRPLPVGPPPEHKLDRKTVVDEMERAGWRLDGEIRTLPYQYVLVFDAASGTAASGASR